jgi:phosphoglycolate phosphatase
MAKTRLIIFDFDGTLYDTIGGIHTAVNTVAGERGVPPFELDTVRGCIGFGLESLLEQLDRYSRHKLGDLQNVKARFREVYNKVALSESSLYPGVMEFLRSWPHELAIVSNKEEFSLRKMVATSALAEFSWKAVYGGRLVGAKKTAPPTRATSA